LLKPFIQLALWLQFGKGVWLETTSKVLKNVRVPHVCIAGEKDTSVPMDTHHKFFMQAATSNPLVTEIMVADQRHNAYLSKTSEAYLLDHIIKGTRHFAKQGSTQQKQTFFKTIEYGHMANHNDELIDQIVHFFLDEVSMASE
jgi:hypothetical protein